MEGPEESLAIFASDPGVTEITPEDCCTIGEQWDTPKEIDDKSLMPGSRVVCPDCGEELSCPDCGPMNGKTPATKRRHKGFDPIDVQHHIGEDVVKAHMTKKAQLTP